MLSLVYLLVSVIAGWIVIQSLPHSVPDTKYPFGVWCAWFAAFFGALILSLVSAIFFVLAIASRN